MKEGAPTYLWKGASDRGNDTSELEMLIEQKDGQWLLGGAWAGTCLDQDMHHLGGGSWKHGFESQCDLEALTGFEQGGLMVSLRVLFIYLFNLFIFGCIGSSLWCPGFSLRWLLLLWSTGSRPASFSSCGTWAQ